MWYRRSGALLMMGVFIFVLSGCGKEELSTLEVPKERDLEEWSYERVIDMPIIATSEEDMVLGNIEVNAVQIDVPRMAFDEVTEVKLVTPETVPGYVPENMQMIGAPIEIDSSGEQRLNEPMTITFGLDENMRSDEYEAAMLRMVYYDGERWDTIKPFNIDAEAGLAQFQLYHFSLLGRSKVDSKVVTQKWIQSQSLNNYVASNTEDMSDAIAEKAIDLTLEEMGITDKTLKGAILADIIKNDSYKDMYDAYQSGDVSGFNEKFSILLGEKIAQRVPESVLKGGLTSLTESADDVAVVAQAAGYAAEGQYKEAAKMVGEMISDKFLITTAGKIAVEVVQGQIDSWKNEELDAAYKAYKNGANNRFWGYNVDAGDFDAVWRQMRGIGRQVELEAINKENAIREDAGMPELTEKEQEKVRVKVRESMRKQFEARSQGEDKIKYEEQQLKLLMDTFEEAGFLDKRGGPQGLQKGYSLETKLDVLHHFAQKMMRETGRYELSDNRGLVMRTKLSVNDILMASRYYFSEPDGRKKYAEYLKERWNVDLYPKLSELSGTWENGKFVITDVEISEEMMQQAEEAGEGCDFDINLEDLKGQELPMAFSLEPSGESGGTMTVNSGDDAKSMPFTYTNGVITATMTEDGSVSTLTLPVSKEEGRNVINGSVHVDYADGAATIKASISASKGSSQ